VTELVEERSVLQARWTVSNILSLSRVFLLVPILYLLLSPGDAHRVYAVGLMLLASATDFFDGLIARRYQQESEFGRVIDPLADKICAGAVVIVLSALGDIPPWFVLLVIGRDALILLGGLYIAKVKGVIYHSNWPGKWAMAAVAGYTILAALRSERLETGETVLLWASVILLVFSLSLYSRRFYEAALTRTQLAQRSDEV